MPRVACLATVGLVRVLAARRVVNMVMLVVMERIPVCG